MGASNSTVIRNGDWEHHICWLDTPPNTENNSEITESVFKRKTNLTRSFNLKYQSAVHRHKNWKKLKVQTNSKEVKNSYELDSIGSATPSVKTTYTEELFV